MRRQPAAEAGFSFCWVILCCLLNDATPAQGWRIRFYAAFSRTIFNEKKASITNKLARATMSAHFFLAPLAATGRESVTLEDI
ncbi:MULTISPECIES: hypothetical protein [unclassified Mesorhizobium]|uniref:hypothetical protein n=1 Tax=unclassified Mesorhizobium TaxID=325217 RepID=UPI0033380E41